MALALVVFGAYDSYPIFSTNMSASFHLQKNKDKIKKNNIKNQAFMLYKSASYDSQRPF